MRVQDIMSQPVRSVTRGEAISKASQLMKNNDLHHLVVLDGRNVVGVVSSRDLSDAVKTKSAFTVGDLMSEAIVTAEPRMSVRQAANRMRGRNIGSLPVMDKGKLVGIVTTSDLLELVGRGGERGPAKPERATLSRRGGRNSQTERFPRSRSTK